jgi:lipopolysaccharide transport system permease protein
LAATGIPNDRDAEEVVPSLRLKVIEPPSGWQVINLNELWRYRELLYFFAWRDVKVRYKQTLLGAAWAVLQPLMMMFVFTIFLGRLAGVDSGGLPYPLFVYSGLLPWMLFSTAISSAGNSVVSSESIITKIYFPRLLVPFAAVAAALVDSVCALVMLLLMLAYYRIWPGWSIVLVPGVIAVTAIAALGVGTLLAAMNVAYRDVKYVIPFLIQLWMFATPTIYLRTDALQDANRHEIADSGKSLDAATTSLARATPSAETGDRFNGSMKPLLTFNPMNGIVAFFRAAALGLPLPWAHLVSATAMSLAALLLAVFYFRRIENTFADVI